VIKKKGGSEKRRQIKKTKQTKDKKKNVKKERKKDIKKCEKYIKRKKREIWVRRERKTSQGSCQKKAEIVTRLHNVFVQIFVCTI
jgi:hypothetical protein